MNHKSIDINIGSEATKTFTLVSITIYIMAILSGANIISNSFSAAIQALSIIPILILTLVVQRQISITFIFAVIVSIAICIINESVYMLSGTMMIVFIYTLNSIPDIDYQKMLKWIAFTSMTTFGMVVGINLLTGWGSNNYEMWRGDGFIFRKSLGFSHPNVTMLLWVSIVLTICSIYKKSERLLTIFVGVSTYFIYSQTQSRTSTYVIMLYCFSILIIGKHVYDRVGKTLSKLLCILLPILFFLISLYSLLHPYSEWLDALLSGRLSLYQQFYDTYGIHLLNTPELENAMFDNGYLQSLLAKGVIFTIQLLFILTSIGWKVDRMRIKDILLFGMYISIAFTETVLQHFELFLPIAITFAESHKKEALNY
ncbi:polysaccharide polymerase [Lactobacillus delbrueckii subsp. lactis]|uniref:hypothetical protein n=1 Tax=Lactobacillus delbrueckii TaxID=1584 RepID=UPI000557B919|nr:hypothetical protein [Lactobacillus delbrueckii]MCD5507263.1 polysaccharide polymerase [Lactobacillus delbrueckii subsp. lactis]MCD5514169.1 polysaccharide polymerase [Lactobacillus delbrueckii subsp. lactis]MCD5520497.1 polysaccharide polymerase [Lactobacillus delbrueckii subsp. lactis]MCD5524349.1 polysaccharide polymerase [Lactobacillus delbrueckii subsp. lactis]MCD5526248.1 polysaccharide polymerase [Lactobacillus delbrueckii subsp. lactis]